MQEYDKNVDVFEEENNSQDSKIERYEINTFTQDRAIETLLKWYNNGKLILPEFQRDYVWTYANSSRLIESILLNLPIPNIFLFKIKDTKGEKFLLIDGLQRITTINQFVTGTWEQGDNRKKFKIQSPNEKWNKKTFATLDENDKQFIYDYPIGTTIFESSSGKEVNQNNVIFSVFERINTGSEKLSDQEIRNAIYEGDLLKLIKDVSSNKEYLLLTDKDKTMFKRGKNLEVLLRFAAYKRIYDITQSGSSRFVEQDEDSVITTSKKLMLNNYMHYSNSGDIDFKKDIDSVVEAISIIAPWDETAFYGKARETDEIGTKVHELFAEALVLAVIENDYTISISKENFVKAKIKLWNSEEDIEPFKYKTTDPQTVDKRVKYLLNIIRG